jgi:branched-chain amino acid transport system substrate-binding protein
MPSIVRAQGAKPIIIGEINSYSTIPAFTEGYRKGWQLALEGVNQSGGVLGRELSVISRDDGGKPEDATREAAGLVDGPKADLLAGGYLSNVGLALSDYAKQAGKVYVAGEPLSDALTWQHGNATCFRLRPSTYMQVAMLLPDALALKAKRWATVAPNYEYGQSAVKWFRQLLTQADPSVQFVGEQWPALGKIDAGAVAQAVGDAKPDAIFNVTFGADLTNFVREGNTRGVFEGRGVVSLLTGEPEYLRALGDETPEGWIVTGYPVGQPQDDANIAFLTAYQAKFGEAPGMGSVVGYALINSIAAGIARAGSVETAKLIEGLAGARFATPFGEAMYRAIDHQGTLGSFVGKTKLQNGKGTMTDWRYVDGASACPPDGEVRRLRG